MRSPTCSTSTSPLRRQSIGEASPMLWRCGATLRPQLRGPHPGGLRRQPPEPPELGESRCLSARP
eukprot:6776188-Pyramimonas_sp.AAC.1